MLSDREIREIKEGRRRGLNGPVLQNWLSKLLTDRRERLQQLAHVRQRLKQPYICSDKLLRALEAVRDPGATGDEGRLAS